MENAVKCSRIAGDSASFKGSADLEICAVFSIFGFRTAVIGSTTDLIGFTCILDSFFKLCKAITGECLEKVLD